MTFLPGDPPRRGVFLVYDPSGRDDEGPEVLVQAGSGARRRRVPARRLEVAEALRFLLSPGPGASASALAWGAALSAGLGILAQGRLYPAVSAAGYDAWRAGPLGPAELRLLADLGAGFPAAAHALPLGSASPLRARSPEALIRQAWDALADVLPRTAGAQVEAGGALYAAAEPQDAEHLRPWLADAARGLEGGASVALRVEMGGGEEGHRALLQLTSKAESSLVVDAADLFGAPAAVLARFGEDAETDLLLALRRGARAWAPMGALLKERVPAELALDDETLADLLGDGAGLLAGAGIEVLWPKELLAEGVKLSAFVDAPEALQGSGLDLAAILSFRWRATLDGELLSEEEVDALAEAKRGLVRIRGRWVAVDPAVLARLRDRASRPVSSLEALAAALAGTVDLDGEQVPVVVEGPIADLAERLSGISEAVTELPAPEGLKAALRPYQARGLAWLAEMAATGLGGCLADDMGLGKTLQVIALHLCRRADGGGPTLVVCPTSLIANWEREVTRFAPEVPVRRFHGTGRNLEAVGNDEVVVTSYGVSRLDTEKLAAAGFSMVVADEVQHAKNPHSATAKALRAIPAAARLGLTGTPVENRLSDLWSILDWTTPGLLGPLEHFTQTVAVPIERYRDPVSTERLARTVRPFLLRRRKTDPEVAPDLPERIVTDVPVPLTTEQTTLYEAEVREALAAIEGKEGFERQGLVLRLLMVLKQICNHPAQYLHEHGPLAGRSGKLAALEELLEVILAEDDSVLVFSQFVAAGALIEARLAELGVPALFLHGGVPAKRRAEMVERFQAGEAKVFLLSLKAGGVGLNLTRATHVVHYDRWWNPAVEDQATDRAHRIGQTRTVQVHRLVTEGTLEDRIAELIERKRELAEAVVGGGEAWISKLSDSELRELVSLGKPG